MRPLLAILAFALAGCAHRMGHDVPMCQCECNCKCPKSEAERTGAVVLHQAEPDGTGTLTLEPRMPGFYPNNIVLTPGYSTDDLVDFGCYVLDKDGRYKVGDCK